MLKSCFRNNPYRLLCILLFVAFIPIILKLPALNDLFVHAATLERLQQNFWRPRDPMVNEPGLGNPYFSPYMVFWAVFSKFTGLGTFTVLRFAATLNVLMLLLGIGGFVRTLSRNRWAPVAALACMFFLWGTAFIYWSGFISLPSLIASMAYPSTFAVGLTLLAWTALDRLLLDANLSTSMVIILSLGIGIGAATVMLSHQFTALGACTYAGFFLVRHFHIVRRRVWIALTLTTIIAILGIFLWPWYNLFSASGGVSSFNDVHQPLYRDLTERYVLLLLALPALYGRLRSDHRDPLVWTVVLCGGIFAFGGITGQYFLGRIMPTAAMLSQIAVGIAIARSLQPHSHRWHRAYAVAIATALTAGLLFQSGTINLIAPGSYPASLDDHFHSRMTKGNYKWLAQQVPFGDTVMTANWDARVMAPAYGIFTVMPAWPDPTLGASEAQRRTNTKIFFRAGTPASKRSNLMKKYDAQWVIVTHKQEGIFADDPRYVRVAERPDTGPREETLTNGRQELYRYSNR